MTPKKNITILLVEDERTLKNILSKKLKAEGFRVLEAINGEEGYELAIKKHPDLILTDILMPKLDGISMIKKIREDSWGKDSKIVLITNYTNEEQLEEAKRYGVDDYYVKTTTKLDDLMDKLKEKFD